MANKESMDVLVLVEELVKDTKAALADGKITVADLKEYIPSLPKFRDAVVGAKLIPGEVVTYTQDEVAELIGKVIEIVSSIFLAASEAK